MMLCQRCKTPVASEAEARRHLAQAHADEQLVADLSLNLSGLGKPEAQLIVRLVERLRARGYVGDLLRADLVQALAGAAERDGNATELRLLEAMA
jgi:hypothetical protein